MNSKFYFGVRQRNAFKFCQYVGQLRLVRLYELASGRNVEEQVFHRKVSTDWTADSLLANELRAFDANGST